MYGDVRRSWRFEVLTERHVSNPATEDGSTEVSTGEDEKKRQKRGGKGMLKTKKKEDIPRLITISRAPRGKKKSVTVVTGLSTFGKHQRNTLKLIRRTMLRETVASTKSSYGTQTQRRSIPCTFPSARYRVRKLGSPPEEKSVSAR